MKTSRGFTLAELLVVMAIIAVLAAILFPVIRQAQDTARMRVCASNLKQIGEAFRMYLDDNNGFASPCLPLNSYCTFRPDPFIRYCKETAISRDERNPKRLWICPGDVGYGNQPPMWKFNGQITSSYYYPYAAYLAYPIKEIPDAYSGSTPAYSPRRVEQWARPSRDLLLADLNVNFHRGRKDTSVSADDGFSVKCVNILMLDGHITVGTGYDLTDGSNAYAITYDNPYHRLYNPGHVRMAGGG